MTAASRELVASLERLGLAEPEILITAVEQIDRLQATGKLRRFVPLSG